MFRRDYVIRLIEEFGVLWARLVEYLRGADLPAARLTIDRAYQQLLGLPPYDVQTLSVGNLVARLHLGVPPEAGREQCWVLSALFRAEGDLALAAGLHEPARRHYQRALELVSTLHSGADGSEAPGYAPDPDELQRLIEQSDRTTTT